MTAPTLTWAKGQRKGAVRQGPRQEDGFLTPHLGVTFPKINEQAPPPAEPQGDTSGSPGVQGGGEG